MISADKKNNINLYLYVFILYSLLIDIGGSFGIKKISFIILVTYVSFRVLTNSKLMLSGNFLLVEGMLFIIYPLMLVFQSIVFLNIDIKMAFAEISAFIIWMMYPVIVKLSPKELIAKYREAMFLGAILIIAIFLMIYTFHFIGRSDLIEQINQFSAKYSLGYIGQKPMGGSFFIPNVFFRWTFLIIPAVLLFMPDLNFKFKICFVAIILTFSTGAIIFTLMGIVWTLISSKKLSVNKKQLILTMIVFFLLLGILLNYFDLTILLDIILSKFSKKSGSTSIKLEHIKSILNLVCSDTKIFLFGMGLGSSFYTTGLNANVVNVEVSHFNLIRQFGIIYTISFFIYIYSVYWRLKKTDSAGNLLGIGLICIFFVAGTNPLLISPVFFVPLVIGRAYITSYKKHRKV